MFATIRDDTSKYIRTSFTVSYFITFRINYIQCSILQLSFEYIQCVFSLNEQWVAFRTKICIIMVVFVFIFTSWWTIKHIHTTHWFYTVCRYQHHTMRFFYQVNVKKRMRVFCMSTFETANFPKSVIHVKAWILVQMIHFIRCITLKGVYQDVNVYSITYLNKY